MKRIVFAVALTLVTVCAFAEPVPIPFAGDLYLVGFHYVNHDGTIGRVNDVGEFKYPGSVVIRENGTCAINYTNGLYEEFTWEHQPEMENVIVITPQQGPAAYLSFARIPDNDVTTATWTVTLIGAYTSAMQARTYLVAQRE